jgi:hypothetical protein
MKILAVFLVLYLLVSCGSLPPSQASLIGEWRYCDEVKACHYFFEPDGRFHGEVILQGKTVSRFAGRWSVNGDNLLYEYTSDTLHRIPVGATDQDRLVRITAKSFTIIAADGREREYSRVR